VAAAPDAAEAALNLLPMDSRLVDAILAIR
jgi:hypothetical protein